MNQFPVLLFRSWWLPVSIFFIALGILVFSPNTSAFPISGIILLAISLIWLMISAYFEITSPKSHVKQSISNNAELIKVQKELDARIREAGEFKIELEAKKAEITSLRAGLNRKDLQSVNEAIASFYEGFEFIHNRYVNHGGNPAATLDELAQLTNELLTAAALIKGLPKAGELFTDQPPGSTSVFNKSAAPTPELKGRLKEVRNSWIGFNVDGKIIFLIPSRISVYI